MTQAALVAAGPNPWLSQGDIFADVLIPEAAVKDSQGQTVHKRGPALLFTHGCAMDKIQRKGGRSVSRVEYLTFLPLHDVRALGDPRATTLRQKAEAGATEPYEAMYLGVLDKVGECYAALGRPFTIPALFLGTELKEFTVSETGDVAELRLIPTSSDTRLGGLTDEALQLLHSKWMAYWLSIKTKPAL